MRTEFVEFAHPGVEIDLQLVDRRIDPLAEVDAIELVEHGPVEMLDDSVRLRALGLGASVIDVLDRAIEFVFAPLGIAAIFASAIGEHALERNAAVLIERDHSIVQQIGGSDRLLAVIELGEADLGVGVDEGLGAPTPRLCPWRAAVCENCLNVRRFPHIDFALAVAASCGWHERRDQRPFRVGQITGITEAATVTRRAMFGFPRRILPKESGVPAWNHKRLQRLPRDNQGESSRIGSNIHSTMLPPFG